MLAILSGFILGVITVGHFTVFSDASAIWFGVLALCAMACWLVLQRLGLSTKSKPKTRWAVCLVGFCATFLFGASLVHMRMNTQLEQWRFDKRLITADVLVEGISQSTDERVRQVVRFLPNSTNAAHQHLPTKWLARPHPFLADEQTAELLNTMQPAQRWRITAEVMPPHGTATKGVFSQERWYLQMGVGATARVLTAKKLAEPKALDFSQAVAQHRLQVRKRIIGLSEKPTYRQDQAVLLGLLTGDRSLIEAPTNQLYQHLGISHLLAISGPHVLFAAAAAAFVLIRLLNLFSGSYRLLPKRTWVLPLSLLVALAYALLAGWDVPAQRTVFMFALTTLALLAGKRFSFWSVLLTSAGIILLVDPLAVLSAGFWLSFLAVGLLLMLGKSPLLAPKQSISAGALNMSGLPDDQASLAARWLAYFQSFVVLQLLFFVAILPISILFFGKVSLLTPLANLFAIPFLGFVVVPLNILAYLVDFISHTLADVLWHILLWLLHQFHGAMRWLQTLSPDALVGLSLDKTSFWVAAVLGLLWLLPCGRLRLLTLPLLVLMLAPRQLRVPALMTVFDGTDNTAILIQVDDDGRKKHVLYLSDIDTKAPNKHSHYALKNVILPSLIEKQVDQIDLLIMSLSDKPTEHDIALVNMLNARVGITQIMSNIAFSEQLSGMHIASCMAGKHLDFGNMRFEFLSPWRDVPATGDDAPCMVKLSLKKHVANAFNSALIMGNASKLSENMLLALCADIKTDVLVLSAQGSDTANGLAFLEKVAAKRAIAAPRFENFQHLPQLISRANVANTGAALDIAHEKGSMTYTFGVPKQPPNTPVEFYRHSAPWLKTNLD